MVSEVGKQPPWRQSQLRTTAFSFVAMGLAAGKRFPWWEGDFLATAFSFVIADSAPHLGGLSEGLAEQGSPFHWLHLYGRGVAS